MFRRMCGCCGDCTKHCLALCCITAKADTYSLLRMFFFYPDLKIAHQKCHWFNSEMDTWVAI